MKRWLTLFLFATLLATCSTPAAVTDTPLPPTVTLQPAETQTPTPEATATPTETPTPEVKQFPICAPENLRDCEITKEELTSSYFYWLQDEAKKLSCGPNMRTDVKMENFFGIIMPDHTTSPHFSVKGSEFFIRDYTAAYLKYTLSDGTVVDYAIMPLFMCDLKDRTKVYPIITVYSAYYPPWKQNKANAIFIADGIWRWRNDMRITAILPSDEFVHGQRAGMKDPLVTEIQSKFPDMPQRFESFVKGDWSALSQPGIVVLNDIVTFDVPWYK